MQKWEYKLAEIYDHIQRELNRLGEEGWELVAVAFNDKGSIQSYLFKRLLK